MSDDDDDGWNTLGLPGYSSESEEEPELPPSGSAGEQMAGVLRGLLVGESVTAPRVLQLEFWRELGAQDGLHVCELPTLGELPTEDVAAAAAMRQSIHLRGYCQARPRASADEAAMLERVKRGLRTLRQRGFAPAFIYIYDEAWLVLERNWRLLGHVLSPSAPSDVVLEPAMNAHVLTRPDDAAAATATDGSEIQRHTTLGGAFPLPHRDHSSADVFGDAHAAAEGDTHAAAEPSTAGVHAPAEPSTEEGRAIDSSQRAGNSLIGTAHGADESSPLILSLWVPLTDVTSDNGCMFVLPRDADELLCQPEHPHHLRPFDQHTKRCYFEMARAVSLAPLTPGQGLAWLGSLVHWGGVCARYATAEPRASLTAGVRRRDARGTALQQQAQQRGDGDDSRGADLPEVSLEMLPLPLSARVRYACGSILLYSWWHGLASGVLPEEVLAPVDESQAVEDASMGFQAVEVGCMTEPSAGSIVAEHSAVRVQAAARAHAARARVTALHATRASHAVQIQRAMREWLAERWRATVGAHAATTIQACVRGRAWRSLGSTCFFTLEPLRTCGASGLWKVGVGDLTKQLSVLHSIGSACGHVYVHTPLHAHGQALRRAHRGSTSVDDIDIESFLNVGDGERPVSSLPPSVPRKRIVFDEEGLVEAAEALMMSSRTPRLLILCFRYELLNSPRTLATLASRLGVPPLRLRSTSTLSLANKYAAARARDGYTCGWRAGARLRVAVHVRRGDRAWLEDGDTLYCMHPGLWTAFNLGRSAHRDGTLVLAPADVAAPRHLVDGIRARAPPAALFAALVEQLRQCVAPVLARHGASDADGRVYTGADGGADGRLHDGTDGDLIDILVLSDGYGEEYHTGFGDSINAAFAAKQADDWATLGALRGCTVRAGNDDACTRAAIDAMITCDVLITGGGSHLPDLCQRYLRTAPAGQCVLNAWSLREEIGNGQLPEQTVSSLREVASTAMVRRCNAVPPPPIILITVEGLCARLSTVLSYRLVAIAEGRRLLVVWEQDAACGGHFLDVFEPLEAVTFVDADALHAYPPECIVRGTIDFHERIRHHAGLEAHCFASLVPLPDVAAAVAENMRALGDGAAAVHVRRTDHFALSCDRVASTADDDFIRYLSHTSHSSRPIYLATDNAVTQQAFRDRYPNRVHICAPLAPSGGGALRHSSLKAAVIDLLTCVRCKVFKGSAYSSFSDVIAHIRRSQGAAHPDDEHEPSGLWQLQRAPSAFPLLERAGGYWASDTSHPTRIHAATTTSATRHGGPLCSSCSSSLLDAARRALPKDVALLERVLALAMIAVQSLRRERRPGLVAGHAAAAHWLASPEVGKVIEAAVQQPAASLNRICQALFACGCVGAADPPSLTALLAACHGLGATVAAAILTALWAHAHRSFLAVAAALADDTRIVGDGSCASGDDACPAAVGDGWLETWRTTRLPALRDGSTDSLSDSSECDAPPSLRCWRCLAPALCGGARCGSCIATYCTPTCQKEDEGTHEQLCALVRAARPPAGRDADAAAARIAQTYCAWRSDCPGWRSTHLDRRRSGLEDARAAPLWDALPFVAQEQAAKLYGGAYACCDSDED